uniref:CCHC-type domain-containing protein n=1 Tax=Globodera pallida TaxID=36090 RepID=A0A183C5R8_GLOPA
MQEELNGHLELLTSQRTASGSRPAPVSQPQPPPQSNIRLPPNQLPVFTGNYVDWPTYWSTFESTIDKNNSFGEAEKLGYLIMTLAKLQQEEIRGYQLTTGGYQLAKAYLKARYGNEEFIKRALYKELKNLYPAKRVEEVRQNWIAMNRILMQLEKLGEDITSQSLLQDMEQKFHDWVLKEVVGEQVQKTGKWTPQKFLDVVDRVAKIREITFDIGNPAKKTGPQYAMYVAQGEMNRTASFPARDTKTTARFNHQGSTPLQQLKRPCIFCTQTAHSSAHCPTYPTKDAKINRLTALRKCLKCFGDGHFSRNCTAKIKCRKCGKGHYFAVCGERPQFGDMTRREQTNLAQGEEQEERTEEEDEEDFFINEEAVYGAMDQADKARPEGGNRPKGPTAEPRGGGSQATEVICSSTNPPNRSKTILATKYVEFMSRDQEPLKGLVFLDCGATCPFIGESFSVRLGFWDSTRPHQRSLEVDGYGGRKSTFGTTLLKIGMRLRNGRTLTLNLNTSPNLNQMSLYYAINQRDFRFEEELPVKIQRRTPDVVLGLVEMFTLLERVEKITENRFVLWSSIGPIVCGRPKTVELIGGQKTTEDQYYLQCKEPSHTITDFWSLEVVGIQAQELEADDDALAWRLFEESIIRLPDGRYEVGWPWRDTGTGISDNFGIAIGRLKSLYKRWQRDNPVVLEECHKIIKEQIESGIIEMAPLKSPFLVSYLPHQAVTKETSAFTKIRMVFDASAGKAPLNKELLRGAVLIPKVAAVLLRMRLPKYLCMSDVAKAFLQLSLRESDRDVTRFLWMKTIETPPDGDNLVAYRFRRVPFGVVSSPFLLIATIHHHLNSYAKNQDLCNEIKASLYMDNILFGAESPEEILDKYRTTKEIFATAQMQVREFCSNCEEANGSVEEGDKHPGIAQGQIKLLGIKWLFRDDVWVIALPLPAVVETEKLTKKGILSVIHSIFDPLGVISPTLLEAKLLFQKICSRKIGWTDPLNKEERTSFTKILGKWEGQTFRFHRSVGCLRGKLINTQLHCFVDASKDAYAAAVYLRVESEDTTNATILFAKNRIVPLDKTQNKTLTIPRLELLAILIGTRALCFVREELHIELTSCHLWSDSQIALSWVKGQRDRETFVLNRLKEIQSHEWIQFHFVPTDANPADIGTRYVTGPELSQSSLWWAGPEWLKLKSDRWPSVLDFALPQPPIDPEECFANIEQIADFTHHMQGERFSRWWPLVRATIFFLRAIFKFLRRVGKTPERLNHAKTTSKAGVLTSNDYKVATLELIRQAQERDPPEEKNKKNWGTFCDENGITVKKALRECLGNCKQRKPFGRPLMPPLPETRTRRSLVFAHVGLDYMGVLERLPEICREENSSAFDSLRQRRAISPIRQILRRIIPQCFDKQQRALVLCKGRD